MPLFQGQCSVISAVYLNKSPSQLFFATKFGKNKAFARKTAACEIRNTFAIAIAMACTANIGYAELVLYIFPDKDFQAKLLS